MAWLASVFSSNTAQHYYADRVYAVSVLKRRRVRPSVCLSQGQRARHRQSASQQQSRAAAGNAHRRLQL